MPELVGPRQVILRISEVPPQACYLGVGYLYCPLPRGAANGDANAFLLKPFQDLHSLRQIGLRAVVPLPRLLRFTISSFTCVVIHG